MNQGCRRTAYVHPCGNC